MIFRAISVKPEDLKSEENSHQIHKWTNVIKKAPLDEFQECPSCAKFVSTKSMKEYNEHVNVCLDRNTDESQIYKADNNNIIIGSTQMVTRRKRLSGEEPNRKRTHSSSSSLQSTVGQIQYIRLN